MDAHLPDDLNELERRLADWQPSQANLAADRMLFAAGRASARTGKLWPSIAACLAVLAGGLSVGLVHERSGRQALAEEVAALRASHPVPAPAPDSSPAAPLTPGSYWTFRHDLEENPDAWPQPPAADPPSPATPAERILQVGHLDELLDS